MILAVCVIGLFVLIYLQFKPIGTPKPAYGGTLTEGIVARSVAEVDREIEQLTMASLVRFNEYNQIQPYLAESWNISEDGKKYTFTIRKEIDANALINLYNSQEKILPGIKWSAPDNRTLVLELKQPYGLLLDNLTKPYFPFGPYQISKHNGKTVELAANETFVLGRPFISKMIIYIYKDAKQLDQALRRHEILGGISDVPPDQSFRSYTIILPRSIFIFFNVKREPFNNKTTRQKLSDQQAIDRPLTATIALTNDPLQQKLAKDLVEAWKPLGVGITLETLSQNDFQSKILSGKNYQALIYGIDLGRDADEYLFWHSSQTGPNGQNISQFENSSVDKLLEEYRLANDNTTRTQKYDALQKILNDERPAILLHQVTVSYQLSHRVKGAKINKGVTPSDRFGNVWEWYIKTK